MKYGITRFVTRPRQFPGFLALGFGLCSLLHVIAAVRSRNDLNDPGAWEWQTMLAAVWGLMTLWAFLLWRRWRVWLRFRSQH